MHLSNTNVLNISTIMICVGLIALLNTLRPRQDGRHFPNKIFPCIFLNENVQILLNIWVKFVPRDPINNISSLVPIMAWRRPGDKPFSEPMMVSSLTHLTSLGLNEIKICKTGLSFHRTQIAPDSARHLKNSCDFQHDLIPYVNTTKTCTSLTQADFLVL